MYFICMDLCSPKNAWPFNLAPKLDCNPRLIISNIKGSLVQVMVMLLSESGYEVRQCGAVSGA